jgi:hypothetical protein
VYRKTRGRPVLFFGLPGASYQHRTASGYSQRSWLSKFGGASGCLVVTIANGHLIIRPFFPFNLFFLPQIYGLEYEVPLYRIRDARLKASLLRRRIDLEFRDSSGQTERISLYLRECQRFLAELGRPAQANEPGGA